MDSHPTPAAEVAAPPAAIPEVPAPAAAPSGLTRFPLNERMRARLDRDYKYHASDASQRERYVTIRETGKELATLLVLCVPESRELHAALTSLETAIMQANAGIARNK